VEGHKKGSFFFALAVILMLGRFFILLFRVFKGRIKLMGLFYYVIKEMDIFLIIGKFL